MRKYKNKYTFNIYTEYYVVERFDRDYKDIFKFDNESKQIIKQPNTFELYNTICDYNVLLTIKNTNAVDALTIIYDYIGTIKKPKLHFFNEDRFYVE